MLAGKSERNVNRSTDASATFRSHLHVVIPAVTFPPDTPAVLLLDQLGGTLRLARVLADARRPLDLTGLPDLAGRLCAACLDLPPEQGRAMRPRLATLLAELDALTAACGASPDASG